MTGDLRFELRLAADPDDDPERVDLELRDFLREARDLDIAEAQLAAGPPPPPGAKGTPEVAAAILVGVTTNALWDVAKILVSRISARRATVRIDGIVAGQAVNFEGDPSEFLRLVKTLAREGERGDSPAEP